MKKKCFTGSPNRNEQRKNVWREELISHSKLRIDCALERDNKTRLSTEGQINGCRRHSHGHPGSPQLNPPNFDSVTLYNKTDFVAVFEIRTLNGENNLGVLNINARVLLDEQRGRKIGVRYSMNSNLS